MRLQDLNWMDVERYLQQDNRIILVTGATEQHAYLSLMTASLIPAKIAEALSQREGVLVAPPLNFGMSYIFGDFPGTISLSVNTFEHVVLEIVESLLHQGFYRFFIINGHSGNQIPERLLDFEMDGMIRVVWYDWQRGAAAAQFAEQNGLQIAHANWSENFPFTRVGESPTSAKPMVSWEDTRERYGIREAIGDGNFGGLYQIKDELMDQLFNIIVDEATELVRSLAGD
jgi:creatinine amidohydrolase